MARKLEAKIAEVLNSRSIAISVGEEGGVQEGYTAIVWRTVEVRDPDSEGTILGSVTLETLRLKISEVYPNFCVASVQTSGPNLFGSMFGSSKVIVSSDREADQKQVRLNRGDAVTILVPDPPTEEDENEGSRS